MGTFKRAEWFNRFNESGSGWVKNSLDLAEMVEPSNPKPTLHPGSLRFAGAKASATGSYGSTGFLDSKTDLSQAFPVRSFAPAFRCFSDLRQSESGSLGEQSWVCRSMTLRSLSLSVAGEV
jgi:hypothetical protein